ncbi:hypothetical protein GLYMA_04G068300v4 [Glycine max]|nr:hypothetical protein GYH30_009173 [Glycine max]KRH61791.2 hypothetical protein GLYMA_04G068300v4 [Glycine max]
MTRMMNHDDVVIDIKAMLEQAEPPVTDECCIYGVPFDICKVKEDAYTPKVVSIGPFHHNRNPRLHIMERHKPIYCNAFLERTHTSLESWICYIEEVMPDFRRCYSDTLEFSTEEPVKIIFVDSGFIFELFWKDYHNKWPGNDTFLLQPLSANTISLDFVVT